MEVSLKRASEYARALGAAASKVAVANEIVLTPDGPEAASDSTYGAVSAAISMGRQKMNASFFKKLSLIDAQYAIRELIDAANHGSGISDVLTKRANLDSTIKMLETFMSGEWGESSDTAETVTRKLIRLRDTPAEKIAYQFIDNLRVDLPDASFVEQVTNTLAQRKRERLDLQDKLGGLNLHTKITLPEPIVLLLKDQGVVA